jgi:DNA repair exonuclease SbcCD ATPase subunit
MSNLEDSANAALEQVRPLRERLADVEHDCDEAAGHVNTLRERLDADRTTLREAVAELARAAQEAGQRLADATPPAESALAELTAAAHDAATRPPQEVQAETGALDAAVDELNTLDPHVAALADAAAEASRTALQRVDEIEQGLAQAIDAAEQLLGIELAGVLAEARRTLEEGINELVTLLQDTYVIDLALTEQDWQAKVATMREVGDKAFADIEHHTREVAEYVEPTLRALADEQLDGVVQEAEALRANLEAGGHEVADENGRLQVAIETLTESLRVTTDGAKIAEKKLDEVRGRWGIEGFPC